MDNEIKIEDVPRRRLVTAIWNLNGRGNGTVTYHMFRRPGDQDPVWPDKLSGAVCIRREKGGTFLASERKASSVYEYDALPIGTQKIEIMQTWGAGQKYGSRRSTETLVRYDRDADGGISSVWE